ncbi:MAG: ATP-binding protein [Acidobacteriia bacterium]|nr:ATP-binding protein [Terriglobia bacterium]
MPLPTTEQNFLRAVNPPPHEQCVARGNEFCARSGMSAAQFGEEIQREFGRGGRSTILVYLRGGYREHGAGNDTRWMDARVWDFCNRNWPKPREHGHAQTMLATRGYREIRRCFEEAVEGGINSLIYGPPSAEKSFVLENLIAERRAAGEAGALYVYCDPGISPLALLSRIAREAEVWVARAWTRERYINALLAAFDARPFPPALVFDEAQHLPVETLEIIRALHDRTRRKNRPGCGIILAGSHNLFRNFMHPAARPRLEQWLSRLPNRIQLEGMSREEVIEIAARAWGNGTKAKFTPAQEEKLLEACEVEDLYASDAEGRQSAPRKYYSARRLLHKVRQQKHANLGRVLAGGKKEVA